LNETNAGLTASGTLTVADPDVSDTVDVSVTNLTVGGTGGQGGLTNAQLQAMLSLSGNSANAADGTQGSVGWAFNSGTQAFDYLAVGETLVLTYTVSASDGHSGSDTQAVTITITGTNGPPDIQVVGSDSAAAGLNETNAPLSTSGSLTVFDPDLSDTVNLSVTGVV